jgi:anaerobic magnesium-protoporphyrin IX monomethyl ester cyclase
MAITGKPGRDPAAGDHPAFVHQDPGTVLLGQSYYLRFDPKLWAAMQPYPPLGTLYAASLLRERGYPVALCDTMLAESEGEWDQALAHHRPRFAVLYEDSFNYLSKMCLLRMRDAAFTMIEMARRRGCTVIVCGADATDHAERYLHAGAHYVLLGEGEETLCELLDALVGRDPKPLEEILGVAYLDGGSLGPLAGNREDFAGAAAVVRTPLRPGVRNPGLPVVRTTRTAVIRNPRRPVIRELDTLPRPAWDLLDVERYRTIWNRRHGYYSVNMVTTRGCPFHCNWCAKPIWGQRYNSRSPENVVAEMGWLQENLHPDHIWFVDDIFGLKPGWLQEFADRLDAAGLKIPFRCLSRADLLHREGEVDALRRSGCQMVWIGAESGSQRVLDAMDKGTTVEQIRSTTRQLRQAGLKVGFFLQYGYPGETRDEIDQTLTLVRECEPDDVGISVSYPLPGTKFHESVQAQLGQKQNWEDSTDLAMMYQGPFSTAFYRQLHRVTHREFRARKAWKEVRSVLFRPSRWRRSHLRQGAGALVRALSLPAARARLDWLGRRGGDGLAPPLPMRPGAAANPSPQEEPGAQHRRTGAGEPTGSALEHPAIKRGEGR